MLRKPSLQVLKHESYIEQGFYQKIINDKNDHRADKELMELFTAKKIAEFMELAVFLGKTIVVAGATGSGKTSYMKTLVEYIPQNSRLITIEDTAEIKFTKHQNWLCIFKCVNFSKVV